jgi:hypothetical protein
MTDEKLEELRKAFEAGGYNAKPSKLCQGSLHLFKDDGSEVSEEEYEEAYARIERERGKTKASTESSGS